jgi:hypothetical protein
MSVSSGAFVLPQAAASVAANLTKEVQAFIVPILVTTPLAAEVVNPGAPQDSVVVYNVSNNYVRGIVAFSAAIVAAGAAPTRTFLVPPGGTFALDFSVGAESANAAANVGAIDSVSFSVVTVPTTGTTVETSTLAVAAVGAYTAGHIVANFATA